VTFDELFEFSRKRYDASHTPTIAPRDFQKSRHGDRTLDARLEELYHLLAWVEFTARDEMMVAQLNRGVRDPDCQQ